MTEILCSSCGRHIAKVNGTQVYTDLICTDPICEYQGAVGIFEQRDAFINFLVDAEVSVVQVARLAGLSRQRVYQLRDTWKAGV